MSEKKRYRTLEMLLRIITAVILIQTLHFKFSGHPEAIYIFKTIGIEAWGRYGIGIVELIVGILFFLPNYWKYASVATFVLMFGATCMHLFTPLGIVIEYNGFTDHGQLFTMAILALLFSCILIYRAYFSTCLKNADQK